MSKRLIYGGLLLALPRIGTEFRARNRVEGWIAKGQRDGATVSLSR
mgnify:CR=1 FL=1